MLGVHRFFYQLQQEGAEDTATEKEHKGTLSTGLFTIGGHTRKSFCFQLGLANFRGCLKAGFGTLKSTNICLEYKYALEDSTL